MEDSDLKDAYEYAAMQTDKVLRLRISKLNYIGVKRSKKVKDCSHSDDETGGSDDQKSTSETEW